jgi:hypothetical protein
MRASSLWLSRGYSCPFPAEPGLNSSCIGPSHGLTLTLRALSGGEDAHAEDHDDGGDYMGGGVVRVGGIFLRAADPPRSTRSRPKTLRSLTTMEC